MVLSAGGAYAFTHFIELSKVRELKHSREEEVRSMEMQRDRSRRLQTEIDSYEQRRRAIQTINRSRTLWSRKLDQFFDIVTAADGDDSSARWLKGIEVPVKVVAVNRRRGRRSKKGKKIEPSARFKFSGFVAMSDDTDALALLSGFQKELTGDPERTGSVTDFFSDFITINNPNIEMIRSRGSDPAAQLMPPLVGAYKYDLGLAPVELGAKGKSLSPQAIK